MFTEVYTFPVPSMTLRLIFYMT